MVLTLTSLRIVHVRMYVILCLSAHVLSKISLLIHQQDPYRLLGLVSIENVL